MASCAIDYQSEENVIQQLNELFGNTLTLEVIRSVAASCKYDVLKSSNRLLEMTSTNNGNMVIEMDDLKMWKTSEAKNRSNRNSMSSLNKLQNEPKKSKRAQDIEKAIKSILKGYKVLVIMRGLPGSGKSHLSKYILENTVGYDENSHMHLLSTDDFFVQKGYYEFDPTLLGSAHNWNQSRAFHALSRGVSPVIIDNTNTQIWEMQPYATMAIDYGYLIEILEPDTHWCFNDKELTKRNRHGVPKSKILDMLGRYDKNVTPIKLLSTYNLSYNLQKPPQLRLYPPPNVSVTNSIKTNVTFNVEQLTNGATALNHQSDEEKSGETIDLMEFNDDDSLNNKIQNPKNPSSSFADFRVDHLLNNASPRQNVVDDILMSSNGSTATNILQPEQKASDTISIDSSDEDEVKRTKQLFPDISSWGINENYIKSWDIVTPIYEFPRLTLSQKSESSPKIITKDSSSNVDEGDFKLWNDPQGYKILETLNRDINRGTPKKESKIPKKSLLDKSCMTDDIYEDYENHMYELKSLFPSVSERHLDYWYNKCKGDLEWTIDFLLEAKESEVICIEDAPKWEKSEEQPNSSHSSDENNETTVKKTSKAKVKKFTSGVHSDLKKFIESKVDISPQNYSKHVLRIKQFKFNRRDDDQQATTSREHSTPEDNTTVNDEVISLDSDSDMEFESVYSDQAMIDKSETTIELNLGDHFVTQLENQFADPNISYPKGFQPVVQVPLTLARQLYTFYIESVFQQMETQNQIMEELTKEDEEFAKKLQAIEEAEMQASQAARPPMSFKEIMEEQAMLAQHQKEAEKWKLLNPDDIAARLTRQKLFTSFPNVDQDTLVEILYAHDNKYQDTVESLLASTGSDNATKINCDIKEPPIMEEVLEEMRDAFKDNISEDYTEPHKATFYREEASKFLKKRTDLYQKAQQYHQRGMNEVAQYYSCLASQQTNYYERANNMAATAFLDEHAKRLEDFNTLDLHFLYVKEAIPALDVFLDRNINLLRHTQTAKQIESLHIITGRGNRSENGIPKLKPVIMNRLKKRNINFVPLNPGLLKVKITKNSSLTSELH